VKVKKLQSQLENCETESKSNVLSQNELFLLRAQNATLQGLVEEAQRDAGAARKKAEEMESLWKMEQLANTTESLPSPATPAASSVLDALRTSHAAEMESLRKAWGDEVASLEAAAQRQATAINEADTEALKVGLAPKSPVEAESVKPFEDELRLLQAEHRQVIAELESAEEALESFREKPEGGGGGEMEAGWREAFLSLEEEAKRATEEIETQKVAHLKDIEIQKETLMASLQKAEAKASQESALRSESCGVLLKQVETLNDEVARYKSLLAEGRKRYEAAELRNEELKKEAKAVQVEANKQHLAEVRRLEEQINSDEAMEDAMKEMEAVVMQSEAGYQAKLQEMLETLQQKGIEHDQLAMEKSDLEVSFEQKCLEHNDLIHERLHEKAGIESSKRELVAEYELMIEDARGETMKSEQEVNRLEAKLASSSAEHTVTMRGLKAQGALIHSRLGAAALDATRNVEAHLRSLVNGKMALTMKIGLLLLSSAVGSSSTSKAMIVKKLDQWRSTVLREAHDAQLARVERALKLKEASEHSITSRHIQCCYMRLVASDVARGRSYLARLIENWRLVVKEEMRAKHRSMESLCINLEEELEKLELKTGSSPVHGVPCLGEVNLLRTENARMDTELQGFMQANRAAQEQLAENIARVDTIQCQLLNKDVELEEFKFILVEKESEIDALISSGDALRDELSFKDDEIETLQGTISEKDAEVDAFERFERQAEVENEVSHYKQHVGGFRLLRQRLSHVQEFKLWRLVRTWGSRCRDHMRRVLTTDLLSHVALRQVRHVAWRLDLEAFHGDIASRLASWRSIAREENLCEHKTASTCLRKEMVAQRLGIGIISLRQISIREFKRETSLRFELWRRRSSTHVLNANHGVTSIFTLQARIEELERSAQARARFQKHEQLQSEEDLRLVHEENERAQSVLLSLKEEIVVLQTQVIKLEEELFEGRQNKIKMDDVHKQERAQLMDAAQKERMSLVDNYQNELTSLQDRLEASTAQRATAEKENTKKMFSHHERIIELEEQAEKERTVKLENQVELHSLRERAARKVTTVVEAPPVLVSGFSRRSLVLVSALWAIAALLVGLQMAKLLRYPRTGAPHYI